MRIPGFLTDTLFYLRTLTTISVLSIGLQTYTVTYIGRKYFTNYENLEVEVGELKVKATGKTTTEALTNLIGSVVNQITPFQERNLSLHATKGKVNFEETRQLFIHGVLTEVLDDGTPAYYNSNILGRYYRKDYFPHDF